jgi:hypothetical protein
MTDDNHGPTEVSTDKTTPAVSSADTTVDGNGERMEVTSRRTYLKTFGLAGLLGAVGLTSPVASGRTLAAQSDALVDSGHLTAEQAAQRFTETKLTASDSTSGDNFGSAVSVSGDGTTALIGAVKDDEPSYGGATYVYDLSGRSPSETELTPSDADFDFQDRFGYTVSVSGDGTTALVGAPRDDSNGRESGAAYVYDLSGRSPTETKLTATDAADTDAYGIDVSVSADRTTALVGASRDDGGGGAVYVYDLGVGAFNETVLTASDDEGGFGSKVSLNDDGTTVLVGAPYDDGAGLYSNTGSAYVYTTESARTR